MEYDSKSSVFGKSGNNRFFGSKPNKTFRSIFGNEIPQIAKAKADYQSSACCYLTRGSILSGGFEMNDFFPTIWKHNLAAPFGSVNMSFGESTCCK